MLSPQLKLLVVYLITNKHFHEVQGDKVKVGLVTVEYVWLSEKFMLSTHHIPNLYMDIDNCKPDKLMLHITTFTRIMVQVLRVIKPVPFSSSL